MSNTETSSVKTALFELVKSQVIRYFVKQLPWLGSKLFNPLFSILVTQVLKAAFEQTELAIYFYKIDRETERQANEVKEKQDNLQKAKTKEEIEKAENELKESLKNLIGLKPK